MDTSKSTSYIVTITGITWEGFEGSIEHRLTAHPTAAKIRELSGDFQNVGEVEITRVDQTLTFTEVGAL